MSSLDTLERKVDAGKPVFSVRQMLAMMELSDADEAVLRYLDFFTAAIPVDALRILHVVPHFELFQGVYEPATERMLGTLGLNQEVLQEMESRIRLHPLYKQSRVLSDLREGNPLERALGEMETLHADLAVIGQRSGSKDHAILAANLARKAKGNVLVIPEKSQPHIDHIVVPVDFSPYSVKAIEQALALRRALKYPVRITCVNVYELPNLNIYLVERIEDVRRMIMEDRQAAFRAFLERYAQGEAQTIETDLVERQFSSVASCVFEYAQKEAANLIVVGAKGHSKVERLLLGSVTENLLNIDNEIPMLIVR